MFDSSDILDMTEQMADLRSENASLRIENSRLRKANGHGVQNAPAGWEPIEAWTDGTRIIVLGTPPDEDQEPEPTHNCDAMGCGSFGPHVLAYFDHPHAAAEHAREGEGE